MMVDHLLKRPSEASPDGNGSAREALFREASAISVNSDVVRPFRYGEVLWAVILFVAAIYLVVGALHNEAFGWPTFAKYFFAGSIIDGLLLSLWMTAVVMLLGFAFGLVVATMRLSKNTVLQAVAWGYVWLFRSIPLLVLLLFWFNIGYLVPNISIGLPWLEPFVQFETSALISPISAAVIALTLHEAAYASEIIRAGILSVDRGQDEAACALAMPKSRVLFRIILPQAMRSIIPNAGSLLIGTLKNTSVVSVVAVTDLLYSTQLIYNRNFEVIPLLLVATIWYIIVTTLFSILQYFVERHFARGTSRSSTSFSASGILNGLTGIRRGSV